MNHLGIAEVVAVSTITRANENRSFQIYEDLAMLLIKEAKQLYALDDDLDVSVCQYGVKYTTSLYWSLFDITAYFTRPF